MPNSKSRRSVVVVLISNVGILGLTFLTGTLNARLLGPAGRGELAAIQTVALTFGALALMGLPTAVAYFSSRAREDVRSILFTSLGLCFLAALPLLVAAYAAMPMLLHSQSSSVIEHARLYLPFILVQPAILLPISSIQGVGNFKLWSALRLTPNITFLVAILWLWQQRRVDSGSLATHYLILLVVTIPLAWIAVRTTSSGSWAFKRSLVPGIVRFGLPSAIMVPAGIVNQQLDQILMAAWLPSRLLGLYAVSVSWSAIVAPVLSALATVLFPKLAAIDDPEMKRVLVARSLRSSVLLILVLTAGLALTTPFLIPLLFGAPFAPAVPVAIILVVAAVPLNLGGLCGEILRGLGAPRWPLYGQVAALPVTVILLAILLPRFSIAGAGLASLLAYTASLTVCLIGLRRCCDVPIRDLLIPGRADVADLIGHLRAVLKKAAPKTA